MTTPRLPDWQARLGALLAQRHATPFAWGSHDCCTFAADAVLAVTGIDPAAGQRDYADALGGARRLQELGGAMGVADTLFGSPIAPLLARVGDVGLVSLDGRDSLAICNGDNWLGAGKLGLVAVPLSAAARAWRF